MQLSEKKVLYFTESVHRRHSCKLESFAKTSEMIFIKEDEEFIKNLYLVNGYGLQEFSGKGWKKTGLYKFLTELCKT